VALLQSKQEQESKERVFFDVRNAHERDKERERGLSYQNERANAMSQMRTRKASSKN
jgi:hypothetical protein